MIAKFPAAFIAEIVNHHDNNWARQEAELRLQEVWDELMTLRAACVAEGYSSEYLNNGVLTKRRAWRD